MPLQESTVREDVRSTLRLIPSPRDKGTQRERNIVTMSGIPSPRSDRKGMGQYGGYKPTVVMPNPVPDESWREKVLGMERPRNPILATPREEGWKEEVLARPRPRNPLFEGD